MRSRKKHKKLPGATSTLADGVTKRRKNSTSKRAKAPADKRVFRGDANVFHDLGFRAPEAANLKIRANLMLDLRQFIQDKNLVPGRGCQVFR